MNASRKFIGRRIAEGVYCQHITAPIVRRLGHKRKILVRATEFVHLTDVVPPQWRGWFFTMLAETNQFTWGDNNRSMVTAHTIALVAEDSFDGGTTLSAFQSWLRKMRRLGDMYVDLEN